MWGTLGRLARRSDTSCGPAGDGLPPPATAADAARHRFRRTPATTSRVVTASIKVCRAGGRTRSPFPPITTGTDDTLLEAMYAFADELAQLPDPRAPRGVRYPLAVLLGTLLVVLAGGADTIAVMAEFTADHQTWFRL